MKKRMAMFYGDKPNRGDFDNGVWMDLLKIPYIEKLEEAANYDIIIRTMWIEAIGWSQEIRKRFPHVIQLGLSDHPLSTHISKLDGPRQVAYIKDLQYLDGIMALTDEERSWYQMAATAKPVVKVGLPFPFEKYEERYGKYKNSPKKFIGLGVGASDNDRNFISNVLVFQRLRLDYPDLKGVFLSIPSQLIPYCNYLCDNFQNMFIQERTNMDDFYNTLSQCGVIINLADRNTPGRLQGEAAFFGVPVVGSDRFELQEELFPYFAVKPYELEKAVGLVKYLLNTPVAVEASINRAHERLQRYNYDASKRKFNKLLRMVESQ